MHLFVAQKLITMQPADNKIPTDLGGFPFKKSYSAT
jgi:hypothetical protein